MTKRTSLVPGVTRNPWPSIVKSKQFERIDSGRWKKRISAVGDSEARAKIALRSTGRNRHR